MIFTVNNEFEMKQLADKIASLLDGGEVLELIGDVGAGKTTFVKGMAENLAITEPIQSPTFTISRTYNCRDNLELHHYDFYRLQQAGIMAQELTETVQNQQNITIIEWSDTVSSVLPLDRLQIRITAPTELSRKVQITGLGQNSQKIVEKLQ